MINYHLSLVDVTFVGVLLGFLFVSVTLGPQYQE